jgi:hypothetical protein
MQGHSGERALLKLDRREFKIMRLATRAVSSYRRKTHSGRDFHPWPTAGCWDDISLENRPL